MGVCYLVSDHVFEDHSDRHRNQVLDCEGRCDGQVAETEELGLLGVEVDERPDRVGVRVEHEEDLVVVGLFTRPQHFRVAHDRLLLKDHCFVDQQFDWRALRPFELGVLLRLVRLHHDRPHPHLLEVARFQRDYLRLAWLHHHIEVLFAA